MPRGKAKPKPEVTQSGEQVRLGVLTMKGLASLWDIDVKTLANKPMKDLPPYSKIGGKRLFFEKDVLAYMRQHMNK